MEKLKINVNDDLPKTDLKNLCSGSIFSYGNNIYMVTNQSKCGLISSANPLQVCIRLNDGHLVNIENNVQVVPYHGTLNLYRDE